MLTVNISEKVNLKINCVAVRVCNSGTKESNYLVGLEVKYLKTVKEISDVVKDPNLSIKEREEFVRTLSEEEMRSVFLQMCSVWKTDK